MARSQVKTDNHPALCYPESSPAVLWTILSCNIITDAYLLWLPIPMLFHATLPRGTKIALGCLFGCGLFVTVAATLRITLVATVSSFYRRHMMRGWRARAARALCTRRVLARLADPVIPLKQVHNFHAIGFWSVRETFVAIATTNLPAIFVLVRRWLKSICAVHQTRETNSNTHYWSLKTRVKSWWSPLPPENLSPHDKINGSPLSSGNRSLISMKPMSSFQMKRAGSTASDKERILNTMPSVQETLSNSRRRSQDSVVLSPEMARMGSQRRGSNPRNTHERPAPGVIRKQVDIMVVEEALHELGAHPRLNTSEFERDFLDKKPLPNVPGAVHSKG